MMAVTYTKNHMHAEQDADSKLDKARWMFACTGALIVGILGLYGANLPLIGMLLSPLPVGTLGLAIYYTIQGCLIDHRNQLRKIYGQLFPEQVEAIKTALPKH